MSSTVTAMSSILKNAQHNNIHNNTFVTKVQGAPSLDKLFDRVASNAILNAGGRADEPRCHPGTREEVIGRIENWRDAEDGSTAPIFWLSGPAGAGKSAIVQTISKRCDERGVPHANFFFFRTDSSRSQGSPLIATLVYQLISLYPSLRDHIATLLNNDPPMIDSALEDQLAQLVVAPLRTIQQSSPAYRQVLFLIDGLDECDSESKRGQQQILQAFDAVLAQHPQACPFRLLVASRNESQIQLSFNKLSSNFLHLYLDDTYSPASDIRKFVDAEFKQIGETHPLRHMLNANWPPVEDIDYIVQKSSGQFIYASTAMRFISDSSAAPTISLERIKGAAQLAKKSPFSYLDAIYTYILLQVDDQEALEDILNAQLLINSSSKHHMSTWNLLKLYNQKYTEAMILSCLADLTPIAQFSRTNLGFYHASFPDFLLDQLRSGDYFVDFAAFSYKILPVTCKHCLDLDAYDFPWFYERFLETAIMQLDRLPPGLLDTLLSLKHFAYKFRKFDAQLWKKFQKLCISDDDIANFRYLLHHWTRDTKVFRYLNRQIIQHVPFGPRYYQMASVRYYRSEPDDIVAADLRPESDFDRHESTMWLKDLLHDIHRNMYSSYPAHYRELLKAWIFWAIQNDIPLDGLGDGLDSATSIDTRDSVDIPYSRRYLAMARIEHDYATPPTGDITAAMRPETDADRHEIALWLKDLLDRIHTEKYNDDERGYKRLLKEWIIWAVQNDIPLDGPLEDLDAAMPYGTGEFVDMPYSRRYLAMARVDCNHTTLPRGDITAALHPETDADRHESASWVKDLLYRIHGSLYHDDLKSYRELLESWVTWAVQNDIPLNGPAEELDGAMPNDTRESVDMPYSRRYFAMARIEHSHATPPIGRIATSLIPESDFDRHESALWLEDLLHDIHSELHSTNPKGDRKLLAAWISWAVWNGISCDALGDLPGAQWYIWVNTLQKWAADAFNRWGRTSRNDRLVSSCTTFQQL